MVNSITPAVLRAMLQGTDPFALIDVREAGEYNSSHISRSSLIPRRQLEFQTRLAVPHQNTPVVVCDDDGRRATLAANTLERMGYRQVSLLEGGINHWVSQDFPTEWGSNVPSKDFGEKMEVLHHVPEIDATELHGRITRGDKLVILDTRTPEEYHRFCIPGGRSVPGGEIALRITDITQELAPDTTVIVNCAGRTRSIIGTRMLQRMGIRNIYGLKNGTSGWLLAGYQLETGATRFDLPEPSPQGIAAAEAYAERLQHEDGVTPLDIAGLQRLLARRQQESLYFIDVRTETEFQRGHIPGFRWFPGGQAVQRSDEVTVVNNCPIVFTCDRKARAIFTASWYRQMGYQEVYAVEGGTSAWAASGLALQQGSAEAAPFGLQEARQSLQGISPQQLQSAQGTTVLFVETSQDFARGHVAGAHWVPRGWLEFRINEVASDKAAPMVVTCLDGRQSALAGATLQSLGYQNVSYLAGGMLAWGQAGFDIEKGLSGVMIPPTDVILSGPERNFADMQNYLRWEEALGEKYAGAATQP